jgi:WD40 repeat protein
MSLCQQPKSGNYNTSFLKFKLRWRPLNAPGVTKNVLISVNSNGSLQHWHTTSGKLLHTIYDELNQLLTVDYKPDGTMFATGGSDCIVRVYDE